MSILRTLLAVPIVASLAIAAPLLAHPKLLSATPADKSVVSAPSQITLAFSEQLVLKLSGFDLTMTAMPGMGAHKPMKIAGFTLSAAADGKTLVAALPRPLPAGTYALAWHAVSVDTHRVEGTLTFTVK